MKILWKKLLRKWDWWIYCRAVHSLRRMTLDNPGMSYLMELFIPCPECKGTRRVWPEGKRGCSQHCDECGDMPHAGIYTGEQLEKRVTYITDFAQSNRRVVMALSENDEMRDRSGSGTSNADQPTKST